MTSTDARPISEPVITSHHFWNLISRIRASLRRMDIRDSQRDDITLIIDEYVPPMQNATTLTVPCQVTNPVIIESILAYSSAGAATIQIGDRIIPIPQGLSNLQGLTIIRNTNLNAILTTAAAGTIFLELFGREIPRMVE